MAYFILKFLHLVGASVLLGTGAGIAFFMVLAHRSGAPAIIAGVARIVVIADFAFTATAVVVQPLTGALLVTCVGYAFSDAWVAWSIVLYLVAGAFWLPVLLMQARMRDLARAAVAAGKALPPAYFVLFRWWFAFGIPAFAAVLAIFWLMIAKPQSLW
jgi:uncharacterized membrane protein